MSNATTLILAAALFLQGPEVSNAAGGEPTGPPQQQTEPAGEEDAHHELLMEALKAKGDGSNTPAIVIASITALGGIAVAVITARRYMRRPKREESRPE